MPEAPDATGSAADDTSRDDQQPATQGAENLDNAEDREPAPAEDGDADPDAPPAEGDAEPSDEDKAKAALEAETVEVEAEDGTKHRIPKALHGAFLMRADYSKKTAEAAAIRREAETQIATFEAQKADSLAALPAEYAKVALVTHQITEAKTQLEAFANVDWDTFRAQAAADPDARALYEETRAAFNAARDRVTDLTEAEKVAKTDLSTKEAERLSDQRAKADEVSAKAWEETGRILSDEKTGIKGWNEAKATELAAIAVNQYGVTPEELKGMHDPRLWRMLNDNASTKAELVKTQALLKKHNIASENAAAQQAQPAARPGSTGASARKTTDASGDGLSTAEWMRRENERVARKREG